jgi:hypothetical protein
VLGLVGWVVCVGSIVAIVLGIIARNQIRASGGRETGNGLAVAGIVLGALAVGLFVVFLLISALAGSSSTT